jgi:SH3-like domain-containing protein
MRYREAVVAKTVVDLHADSDVESERVTQAILGTPLMVAKSKRGWLRVTTPDAYRGWIEAPATRRLKFREPRYASNGRIALVTGNVAILYLEDFRESITVTVDTRLELVSEQSHRFKVRLPDGRLGWVRKEDVTVRGASFSYPVTSRKKMVEVGKRFLGVPYLWGGTTPLGFDCSGFVQLVCKMNGINLPRDTDMQFMVSRPIETKDLQPADLLFFSNMTKGITHVGMFIGVGEFIHASGKVSGVTISPLSDHSYQSFLVGARRVWKNHADH